MPHTLLQASRTTVRQATDTVTEVPGSRKQRKLAKLAAKFKELEHQRLAFELWVTTYTEALADSMVKVKELYAEIARIEAEIYAAEFELGYASFGEDYLSPDQATRTRRDLGLLTERSSELENKIANVQGHMSSLRLAQVHNQQQVFEVEASMDILTAKMASVQS
ncbi:hypothetical protein B0A49_07867 [Cryomyces minteri]|uniref:Uncharacterized protein n=1 Tax=Cryomyces minteri TaxID=331657 RepID=A0A4V5NFY1_9PEZI|nr:hypothetical protein B0A49_07867 [Cryomyces minteri]